MLIETRGRSPFESWKIAGRLDPGVAEVVPELLSLVGTVGSVTTVGAVSVVSVVGVVGAIVELIWPNV